MVALDPRINPFRPEIAAKHLQGQVEAKRFVEGRRHQIIEPATALRRTPSHDARLDSEALLGERVMIYETTEEGWAWGQLENDGHVGWMSANSLGPTGPAPTHKIAVLRSEERREGKSVDLDGRRITARQTETTARDRAVR